MKTILITGASGFIGSFLVEEAINRGFKTFAGVRKTSSIRYLLNNKITFFEADLSDKNSLKERLKQFDRFDYIIHTAGVTKTCKKNLFDKINVDGTRHLIEALQETNRVPDKFIFISSLAAYGSGKGLDTPIELSDTPTPISLYGKSKLKAETYIKSIKDFPYLIMRPTGVYGPREKDFFVMYKSVNRGLETYIGSKKQNLSFVYVTDFVNLLMNTLESNIEQKSYFVSDLKQYTAVEFNSLLKNELNKRTIKLIFPKVLVRVMALVSESISCLFFGEVPTLNTEKFKDISQSNWLCNSEDLVKDFNFKPEYNLRKGLNKTIQWYKQKNLL
jgi:nucleoside-diphosphate-sugar epimerase